MRLSFKSTILFLALILETHTSLGWSSVTGLKIFTVKWKSFRLDTPITISKLNLLFIMARWLTLQRQSNTDGKTFWLGLLKKINLDQDRTSLRKL